MSDTQNVVANKGASPASAAVMPINHWTEAVKNLSLEDFCIQVTRELIERGQLKPQNSLAEKNPTRYAKFTLGNGTGLYQSMPLSAVQASRLRTADGVPMALAFQATILDLTPAQNAEAHRREREIQTAERDSRKVGSLSDNVLLDALNARRAAKGLAPVTEI